jgi:serine/threonine protein kinase
MSELSHPRIVPFVGACLESDRVALVTGLAQGGNLHRALHLDRRRFDLCGRLQLSLDLLEGVAYLHCRKPPVIHLDLKSMNLVLDAEGRRLQICDFGLARKLRSCSAGCHDASYANVGGSPRYMPPECYDGSLGPPTEKSDVWSAGCVLVEIFGSCFPYAECSNVQQILKTMLVHRRGPTVPDSVQPPVREAIAGMLAFEAQRRSPIVQVLSEFRSRHAAAKDLA